MNNYENGKPTCCRDCTDHSPCGQSTSLYHPSGEELDRNGDGVLTRAEFVSVVSDLFNKADQNRDQTLSREELNAGKTTALPTDTDGNGSTTLNETITALLKVFDELDVDDNGVLRGAEYQASGSPDSR